MPSSFTDSITAGYPASDSSLLLGAASHEGRVHPELPIAIPLRTLNRHGLVAGATGTGKTKTLQHIAESLSAKGVPVLIMDMKGDISGISQPGVEDERIAARAKSIGMQWQPSASPVEFMTISEEPGVRMRATISEFGPILLAKMLELNETQESIISLVFKFADDHKLPLCDIKDMQKLLIFLSNEGKQLLADGYGAVSTASIGIILRKMLELQGQGAERFFSEPSFEVRDLLRTDASGKGYINILRLTDIQNRPGMFSTFVLSLVAEIFQKFPEVGDLPQPKLVIMIDEAHLVFRTATKTLLRELETVIKLIRSKGVGIIFCTQLPTDIPPVILSQLGLKIQFALRAFTAIDRKAIKLVSQNYPDTAFYQTEDLITRLGIGEALVTALDVRGTPTPLVHTLMAPPTSRMGTITDSELQSSLSSSTLVAKYEKTIDSESAHEILTKKFAAAAGGDSAPAEQGSLADMLGSLLGKNMGSVARTATNTVVRNVTSQIMRSVLGTIMGRN
ncbi:MAG: helicase HerA-like domain-containing protein [bacterium]